MPTPTPIKIAQNETDLRDFLKNHQSEDLIIKYVDGFKPTQNLKLSVGFYKILAKLVSGQPHEKTVKFAYDITPNGEIGDTRPNETISFEATFS